MKVKASGWSLNSNLSRQRNETVAQTLLRDMILARNFVPLRAIEVKDRIAVEILVHFGKFYSRRLRKSDAIDFAASNHKHAAVALSVTSPRLRAAIAPCAFQSL